MQKKDEPNIASARIARFLAPSSFLFFPTFFLMLRGSMGEGGKGGGADALPDDVSLIFNRGSGAGGGGKGEGGKNEGTAEATLLPSPVGLFFHSPTCSISA